MNNPNTSKLSSSRRLAVVRPALIGVAIGLGSTLFALEASANCAMPTTYDVTVLSNTVTICPMNYQYRGCPDPGGMLREGGGRVVKIPDRCVDGSRPEACYVDDCVPAGEYKYGFATPYECCESCCGTDYYVTATVAHDLPASCLPGVEGGAGGEGPYTGEVPWGDSSSICDYHGHGGTGGGGVGGSHDDESSSSDEGCSCRIGSRFDSRTVVFAANGALVVLGLLLTRKRRRA